MAIELSTFVRTDEFIVKQPRVAMTNSEDTLPPKTRALADIPVWPLPNNIGETGNYPYTADDETPVGDERTGTKPAPNYAVEYLVYVTDEGSGINVSSEEPFELIDGWGTYIDGGALALTTRDPQQGDKSLRFDKSGTVSRRGGVEKEVLADYSAYDATDFFVKVYFPSLTNVESFRFELEDLLGNKRTWSVASGSLVVGWNLLSFGASSPDITSDVGFTSSAVRYLRFFVRMDTALNTLSNIELDDFKGTEILAGKIASADVEVGWARNSNWQTKFKFDQSLNRWVLVTYELGTIENSPRLVVDTSFLNDFANRTADFTISVSGIPLTVSSVANELAFATPSSGIVEFAVAEGTFNFSASDIVTYNGKKVTYGEVADGNSTVSIGGTAVIERNISMTFKANPILSKKDLSLNYTLEDEVIASELSGVNFVRLSFVPTPGTISLRYDPVPDGYPDPLVENVDFTIDDDIPAILLTTTVATEVVLSDFDMSPMAAGDPDSSRHRYEMLPFDNIDVVPNTVTLQDTTGVAVTLVADVDYIVNHEVGQLLLTHGYTEETLLGNVFIEDHGFVDINFSFYINGVEVEEYSLVPQAGWINLDRPLFAGDVPTVDYTTNEEGFEGTVIAGGYLTSPSVVVPGIGRVGVELTPAAPAQGGEFSFSVKRPPVQLNRVEIEAGVNTIVIDGDRTTDYVSGTVLKLEDDHYHIVSSAYDATGGQTTLTLGASTRTRYVNPLTYHTKGAVSWAAPVGTHLDIVDGVSTFTLINEAVNAPSYYEGILFRVAGGDVYAIKAAVVSGADLVVSLTKQITQPIPSAIAVEITTVPIPTEGDEVLKTFYTPIHRIPDRYDANFNLLTLEDRFPGIGGRSIRVVRNGFDLDYGIDYTVALDGAITLRDPIVEADKTITIKYVPFRLSDLGTELTISYSYYSVAPSGVGLRGTMDYEVPDAFYFRVVNNSTQAAIYQDVIAQLVRQKSGQVSSGSRPSIPAAGGNYNSGLGTPVSRVGDLYDNDIIAQRIYDFMTERIGYLEAEKMELSGEVPGGFSGPLTAEDLEDSARGSGRLFPLNASILLRILKKGQEIALPARPYRLPMLFGQPYEDDGSRLVMEEDYPTIPVTTFPPFPPQGKVYKGANQEPTAFGILGVFGVAYAASAPTTFIENWYPFSLDRTYVNPLTALVYTDYSVSPASILLSVQDVAQDTGDPSTATPIFPPTDLELSPDAWQDFDVSTVPLSTYDSAAPRSSVPVAYESVGLGALQSIDTLVEAGTLKGTSHRNTIGDPTSYSDFLGWVYRDMNEYDLLTNGTTTELVLLEAEWQSGARPANLTGMTDNAEQQMLALTIQKESLQRQQASLTLLIAQITPTPAGDPELTTVTEAAAALVIIASALTDVQAALDDIQAWYDDVIVTASGVATDQQIRNRWMFVRGVDVSAISPPTILPVTPVTLPNRIDQVEARILGITARLAELHNTLGFDNTDTPNFTAFADSEDLYTRRFTFLDLRVNRESGTLFKALAGHAQYVRDLVEADSLASILSLIGG